jgi:molybdopterin-guanine dinucleotide biosynthesis protein A/uridine kinase
VTTVPRVVAIVLAGGASRRFGTDKLEAPVDGSNLLDRSSAALPDDIELIVVGPRRKIARSRSARFVLEDPPGGGPAAALIAGLRLALSEPLEAVVVFPADAPRGGESAVRLLHRLRTDGAYAVVGVDRSGRDQPLQLALGPDAAEALVTEAGARAGARQSARQLISRLEPMLVRQPLEDALAFDIDTADDALIWRLHSSPEVEMIIKALPERRPVVVALDGRSGVGKSILAAALSLRTGGTVLEGDDFYQPALADLGSVRRDRMPDADAAEIVIDWRRFRTEALEPLARGQAATFRPYDWAIHDGRLAEPKRVPAGDVVIIDGVYSGRPELADLVDLAVLVETDEATRTDRLARREADDPDWVEFWERAERHYFRFVRPPASFELRVADLDRTV